MSDLDGPIAAILTATPIHPVRGDVITEWVYDDKHPLNALGYTVVHPWRPEHGDPTPVAARQAAAVLRWLAEQRRTWGDYTTWDVTELDELADKIDPPTSHNTNDNENHGQ